MKIAEKLKTQSVFPLGDWPQLFGKKVLKPTKFTKRLFGDETIHAIIAHVEKQRYHVRPYVWTDGKTEYSHIAGAIIMPTFDVPGYLLTAGVRYDDLMTDVIDEYQSEDELELVAAAKTLMQEYGQDVLKIWYGNLVLLAPLMSGVHIAHPVAWEDPAALQIYARQLLLALNAQNKRLTLHGADILRNTVGAFVKDKARSVDNPVIVAAGSLIHTLLVTKPWESAVEVSRFFQDRNVDELEYRLLHGMEELC